MKSASVKLPPLDMPHAFLSYDDHQTIRDHWAAETGGGPGSYLLPFIMIGSRTFFYHQIAMLFADMKEHFGAIQ